MKSTALFMIAALILLTSTVQANPLPLDSPVPDHINIVVCHEGPYSEGSKEVSMYGETADKEYLIATSSTGIPYKWPDGPVVPSSVTVPPWSLYSQDFTVRVSAENIDGTVWPVGNYTGQIMFNVNGRESPLHVRVWIAECTNGPPDPVPEFSSPALPAILILGLLGTVLFIRRTRQR